MSYDGGVINIKILTAFFSLTRLSNMRQAFIFTNNKNPSISRHAPVRLTLEAID